MHRYSDKQRAHMNGLMNKIIDFDHAAAAMRNRAGEIRRELQVVEGNASGLEHQARTVRGELAHVRAEYDRVNSEAA